MLSRCLTALLLAGAVTVAWSQPSTAGVALDKEELRTRLQRIHEAASRRNFEGNFVVSAGGTVSSARISHYGEGRNQFERVESMDGQVRKAYRHNDVVHTLWPQRRVALVEQRELAGASFPALLQGGLDSVAESYELRLIGPDRVADHEAEVLMLRPRDAFRYGYRLWVDKASGLLLRSEVIGAKDEVLESSAFTDVHIGVKQHREQVLQPMSQLEGYRVIRPVLKHTPLEAEGWSLASLSVPGFRQMSSVKRPLDSLAEAGRPDGGPEVLQAIYSDGLSSVSVFIEDYDPKRHSQPMQTASGATQTLMRQHSHGWVTVVGDVPAATLKRFADALQRSKH